MGKSNPMDKSFDISKRLVWEAYKSVKANQGAAGVDGQSVEEFEADLRNNLYRSGIGCLRGPTFRLRCGRLKFRSRTVVGRECEEFPPSPTELLRQWWRCSCCRVWSRSSMVTRMGIGLGAHRWQR